jgi:[ribosomal protein S5]-alanine N-acetyltransferase
MLTDPVVRRYQGGPCEADVVRAATDAPGQTWGSYVIELVGPDVAAGSCAVERGRGELEVSYALLPEFTGMGIATEALRALLAWVCAAYPDEDHVIAVTEAANEPSLRLLDRLGFTERERFVEFGALQVLASAPLARSAAAGGPGRSRSGGS